MANVLIVDDEKSIRLTVEAFLGNAGHRVFVAENAEEADALVEAHPIDVAVVDILLGHSNGLDLARHIAACCRNVQIVFCTGEPEVTSAREAIRLRAFDYLAKPVGKEQLVEVVARAAAEKQRLDEFDRLRAQEKIHREDLERTAALRERKIASVFRAAPVGIGLVHERVIQEVNRHFCDMIGYTRDELIGRKARFVYESDEEYERVGEEKYRQIRESGTGTVETRFRRKDSTVIEVILCSTLLDPENPAAGATFTALDITGRKEAERTLCASEERFNRAMEATRDGLYDWDLATNEIYYSPGWKRMFGYGVDELPNDFSVWESLTEPDGVKRAWEMLQNLVTGKSDRFELEFKMKHKDGHWVDILSRATAVFDENGTAVRVVGTHVDISERKRSEEALRESEARFRLMFQAHDAIMLLIEPETGQIIDANQAAVRFYGYSADALRDMSIDAINCSPPDEVYARRQEASRLEHSYFIFRHKLRNGDVRSVEVHSTPLNVGRRQTLFSIIHDITDRQQAEVRLRETKAFQDTIIDMSPFAMWVSDSTGTVIRTNASLRALLNLTDDQILGAYNILEDDNLEKEGVMPAVRAVFEKHESARFSISWRAADAGNVDFASARNLHIDVAMFPILNAEGELTHVVCQWVDVTAWMEAEEKFRQVLDASPFPVAVVDENDDKVFFWSRSAVDILGHVPKSAAEWYTLAYPDPEYQRQVLAQWHPALELARRSDRAINTGEYRVACADGNVRICELYAQFVAGFLIVTFHDVTDRRCAEEDLRESEKRYRRIVETAQEGIWTIDVAGNTDFVNEKMAEMLGYTVDEMIGCPLFAFMDEEAQEDARRRLGRRKQGASEIHESRFRRKDGSDLFALLSTNPFFDVDGAYLGALAMVADITERRQAGEELRRSETRFRSLYENSPFGIIICELVLNDEGVPIDFLHLGANDATAANTGFDRESIVGKRASELVSGEELAELLEIYGDVVRNGTPSSYSRHFSLYEKTLDVTAFPLHGNTFIINFIDVSERVRAQQELTQQHERLEDDVRERTRELRLLVDAMAGREVRMAELKEEIADLRERLRERTSRDS